MATLTDILQHLLNNALVQRTVENRCLDRSDLRDRADRLHEFGVPEQVTFDLPECTSDPPQVIRDFAGTVDTPRRFVCELSDVRLIGPEAITVTADGKYVLENALCSIKQLTNSLIHPTLTTRTRRLGFRDNSSHEYAISLVGPWADGFYHWFSDYLPRLIDLRDWEVETGYRPTVIYPPNSPGWLVDSLRLVGYDGDRLQEWDGGTATVDHLVVPSLPRHPWGDPATQTLYTPQTRRWVRERVRENVNHRRKDTPRFVFVSRTDASERRIQNSTALLKALDEFGFESVVLSNRSLREQISLFTNAECVVAPHGAGLTNILWGTDLDVIELFGSYVNVSYFRLAKVLGHRYSAIQGKPIGDDIRIDPEEVRRTVECLQDK
ncbi:glycosyltransferase family 61 protein [Haloarcula sp. GH36]|uniref:glycosyltransferase family 61 protein n=1 Tax=Haloarcula montana TaxID=3111776 RepID=UPI002D78A130|nr:glycosyltransferase family 61 protein [Haloarcula sp. GH36]